jgi:hypothetical protein
MRNSQIIACDMDLPRSSFTRFVALGLLFSRAISMIYVFAFRRKQLWRHGYHEKNVPTKQQQTEKSARLQGADVEQGRSAGAEAQARQGQKKANGEWLTKALRSSSMKSGSYAPRTIKSSTKRAEKYIQKSSFCLDRRTELAITAWV